MPTRPRRLLERAIALAPDFLLAILDLGRAAQGPGPLCRSARVLRPRDRARSGSPQAHYLRGATLARASFTHEAIDAYRECLALRPAHIGALLGLGHVLKAVGDYRRAPSRPTTRASDSAPDFGETYWSLANLKTYRFDDATVAEMERRAASAGRQPAIAK